MIPSSGILLAAIDPNLIELVLILTALIIGGLARLMGRQPPVRPPGQQPPARPTPPDVASEIDEFLRRAAQRRANPQAAQPRPLAGQPAAVGPIRPQPQPARAEAAQAEPVRAELVAGRPVGGEVSAHVKTYLDSEKFESRAGELGQEVVQTVSREIDQHLRQVFDHSVSRLAAEPGEAAAAPAVEPSGELPAAVPAESSEELFPTTAMDLAALLSSADLVRQAIVLNEMFRRPEERWR